MTSPSFLAPGKEIRKRFPLNRGEVMMDAIP